MGILKSRNIPIYDSAIMTYKKNISEEHLVSGYQTVYPGIQQLRILMLFHLVFHHQKRTMVLGYLEQNQPPQIYPDVVMGPVELFSMGFFFLWKGCRSILEQAKTCRLIRWYRIALFYLNERQ